MPTQYDYIMTFQYNISIFTVIVISIIISGTLTFVLYAIKDRLTNSFTKKQKITLATLRFIAIFLISFLLFNPSIKHYIEKTKPPTIIFLQDNSSSIIKNKDSLFYKKQYKTILQKQIQKLSKQKNIDFKIIPFDITAYLDRDTFDFTGKLTNFDNAIKSIASTYRNNQPNAVIIASDGIINNGDNPLYNNYAITYPIHTLLLGDTTHYPDAAIINVEYNNIALTQSKTPVIAVIKASKLKGKTITVNLLENGKTITTKKLKINKNNQIFHEKFTLEAKQKGIKKLKLKITTPVAEKNKYNNTKKFQIEVIDATQNILILANSPHPDIGAIKSALSSNLNFKITIAYGDSLQQSGKLSKYNLIILHQLPSQNYPIKNIWQKITQYKIPTLFILGTQTDINTFNKIQDLLQIQGNQTLFEDAQAYINKNFNTFEITGASEIINELPPLKTFFGEYHYNSQAEILLYQKIKNIETSKPLILLSPTNDWKIGIITGENIWRWHIYNNLLENNNDFFESLINNIAKYLSLKVKRKSLNIFVNKITRQDEPVKINAQFFNEIYQSINDPDLNIEITNTATNKKAGYLFSRTQNGYSLTINNLPPAIYHYTASLSYNNKTYTDTGNFTIEKTDIENINTTANPIFMQKLAQKFGGKMFYNIDSLTNYIIKNQQIKEQIIFHQQQTPLTRFWWILIIIITLLAVEWILRKWFGAI